MRLPSGMVTEFSCGKGVEKKRHNCFVGPVSMDPRAFTVRFKSPRSSLSRNLIFTAGVVSLVRCGFGFLVTFL